MGANRPTLVIWRLVQVNLITLNAKKSHITNNNPALLSYLAAWRKCLGMATPIQLILFLHIQHALPNEEQLGIIFYAFLGCYWNNFNPD